MRVARSVQGGRGQAPLQLFSSNSIFRRKLADNATLATDQTPALKLANQCNYANPSYTFSGYSGMGYGGWVNGYQTTAAYSSYTIALYVVDSSVATQTVTYVKSPTDQTPQPAGTHNNLQNNFNAVPVPDVTKIPQGQIWPNGTDKCIVIWRPSTDEMWEMEHFSGSSGAYTFTYGAYLGPISQYSVVGPVSTFNGIFPTLSSGSWGASASGLSIVGGIITLQDIIDVLHGLPIQHAIGMQAQITSVNSTFFVAPANRCDGGTPMGAPQFEADGTTPNPAYSTSSPYGNGFVDAIPEGSWFRFPSTFNPASAMSGAGPLALAVATAIRDYGLVVHDRSGNITLQIEDARVLGSPYSYAKVNPFYGSTGLAAGVYDSYINGQPGVAAWADATLPNMTEVMNSTNSILSKVPWQQLQVLQPFSS